MNRCRNRVSKCKQVCTSRGPPIPAAANTPTTTIITSMPVVVSSEEEKLLTNIKRIPIGCYNCRVPDAEIT